MRLSRTPIEAACADAVRVADDRSAEVREETAEANSHRR